MPSQISRVIGAAVVPPVPPWLTIATTTKRGLSAGANEARKGSRLNPLTADELPAGGGRISNSAPVTGQAGWYDVRVRIYPAGVEEEKTVFPTFPILTAAPGMRTAPRKWLAYFAGKEIGE